MYYELPGVGYGVSCYSAMPGLDTRKKRGKTFDHVRNNNNSNKSKTRTAAHGTKQNTANT